MNLHLIFVKVFIYLHVSRYGDRMTVCMFAVLKTFLLVEMTCMYSRTVRMHACMHTYTCTHMHICLCMYIYIVMYAHMANTCFKISAPNNWLDVWVYGCVGV
jgi:hypothetical protein